MLQAEPILTNLPDLHLLSQQRRRVQANEFFEMVTSALRHVDTRGLSRQPYLHGASHGRRKGAQNSMEVDLLHLPAENGSLHSVRK
jgi:hypothetical protein